MSNCTEAVIVCGYCASEDIYSDPRFAQYLNDLASLLQCLKLTSDSNSKLVILFSGGPTRQQPPFDKTEAAEMARLWQKIVQEKGDALLAVIPVIKEDRSLSTVENIVYSLKAIPEEYLPIQRLHVFSRPSRRQLLERISTLAAGSSVEVSVETSLAFDPHYKESLAPAKPERNSEQSLQATLWALQSEENLERYRQVYVAKYALLRERPNISNDELEDWWEMQFAKLGFK